MPRNGAFRSHAFCRPRFLDGQGDEITGKEPAWKGTVASRIRSLNDMNNAASTRQKSPRPVPQAREEAERSNRASAQRQTDESHERNEPPGRTNPFVRRSPPRVPSLQSRPSVPERVSHSNVPVRAPIPSVLVQRPTFFGEQTQLPRSPATRDSASPYQEINSRQGFGRRPAGDSFESAESTSPAISAGRNAVQSLGPSHARDTLRRFEELESKKNSTTGGLGRDTTGNLTAVGSKQSMQLEATGPWAIRLRKSQPELRTKADPARDMPEAAPDARHGLTLQKASSPNSARPTSPSVGIGPRDTTFGRAGRVRSVSPDEFRRAKHDRAPRSHVRLKGIKSTIQDIETTSTCIEATARDIKAAAHRIGLTSSPSAINSTRVRSVPGVEPHSHAKLQGQPLPAQSSSVATRMRRDTSDRTLPKDGCGASPAPEVIDSIDSILAEHDGVLDNVIEQLQTCGQRLQKIRSLSQQFGPRERDSSASQAVEARPSASGSNLAPGSTAAEVSTAPPAAPTTINDPPALQRKRTRSIPDLIHLVDDAGEKFGLDLKQTEDQNLKEMTEELHRAGDVHELDAAAAETEPISPTELQRLLSEPIATFATKRPGGLAWPTSGARPHLSSRYFSNDSMPMILLRTGNPQQLATARPSTPTPPPSPPAFREERPTRPARTRLNTTLPIASTSPSQHAERSGSRRFDASSSRPGLSTRPSATRRHHTRQPSSYLSAKLWLTSAPITPVESSFPSSLQSLQPTPPVYFPYQHLQTPPSPIHYAEQGGSHVPKELEQGAYCPLFPTKREEPKGPIVKAPDTPPPPPPLFSRMPSMELGHMSRASYSPVASPGVPTIPSKDPTNNSAKAAELRRAAMAVALEQYSPFNEFVATSLPMPLRDSPSKEQNPLSTGPSRQPSEEVNNSSSMGTKQHTPSPGPSHSSNPLSKRTTPSPSPQTVKPKPRRPETRRRETAAERAFLPTSFLSTSTTSSSSSSREASTSPAPFEPPPLPAKSKRRDSSQAEAAFSPPDDTTPRPQPHPLTSFFRASTITNTTGHYYNPPDSSPLILEPSPTHSPTTMATMTAATVAQAQQPLPALVPLPTPPREPPQRTKTFSAYLASFSTPSTSSLSDYSYPSSVEAEEEEEEEGETLTAIATTTNPTHSSEYPLASAAPIAPPTPSITIQPASTTPSNPTASNPTVLEPQAEQGYPPLNVLDRIRILEEAREEQMRILRATGAVPDGAGAVRRYSVGGAREQISGLGEPWW